MNDSSGPFDWDENTQSLIMTSFFYGYVVTQYPGGRLSELHGGKWVFGASVAATAAFTLLTPAAATVNLGLLVAVRVAVGLSEGMSMLVLLARWSKPNERSVTTSLVFSGVKFGTVGSETCSF